MSGMASSTGITTGKNSVGGFGSRPFVERVKDRSAEFFVFSGGNRRISKEPRGRHVCCQLVHVPPPSGRNPRELEDGHGETRVQAPSWLQVCNGAETVQ